MPPKKHPASAKGAAAAAEPLNKRVHPRRGAAAANSFAPDPHAQGPVDPESLAAIFDSLSTWMDERNADTATEVANFDENLQANTHCLDNLFIMLQQIQQALLPAGPATSSV